MQSPAPADAALSHRAKLTLSVDADASTPDAFWTRDVEVVGSVLAADDALLDRLLHAAADAQDDAKAAADELGLTPLEIRRKRNRESMQRARTRQRDGIESMKLTVQQLEAQFQQLNDSSSSSDSSSLLGLSDQVQVEARYRVLAEASRRLKEENYLLEKMLTEKYKTLRRLQQAMVDRETECGLPPPAADDDAAVLGSATTQFFFTPITEQQADDAIKRCYRAIMQLEHRSQPLRDTTTTLMPPSATFGWRMLCHVLPEENGFFVAFTKTFDTAPPADVMLKTWTIFSRPEYNTGGEQTSPRLKMETLQVVNDNAYVASRDVPHPGCLGKTLRTVFLRFRLQTETGGFVIGRACMNPTGAQLRALQELENDVVYGDFSSWIEFREAEGGGGCEVKFGAILAYDTHEDLQLRLVNALMTTITWESAVIRPVFSLPALDS